MAPPADPASHVHHLYVVQCDDRDLLADHLKSRDIQSFVHYPIPVHHQQPAQGLRRDPQGLAVAERHARRCLSIPCHPQMSESDVERVVAALNGFG